MRFDNRPDLSQNRASGHGKVMLEISWGLSFPQIGSHE